MSDTAETSDSQTSTNNTIKYAIYGYFVPMAILIGVAISMGQSIEDFFEATFITGLVFGIFTGILGAIIGMSIDNNN